MLTSNLKRIASLFFMAVLILAGCKKDKDNDPGPSTPPDYSAAEDNAVMEQENTNITSFVDIAAFSDLVRGVAPCLTITKEILDTVDGWPKKLTLDFGPVFCKCADARYRKGKIISVFTGPWKKHIPGDSVTTTTENFYVSHKDDSTKYAQFAGTRYMINEEDFSVADSVRVRIITGDGQGGYAKTYFSNGKETSWKCNRTRKRVEGANTVINPFDDAFEFEGTAEGINKAGKHFTVATEAGKPMYHRVDCKWFSKGVLNITPDNMSVISIDYGYDNGACDNKAAVTIDGNTYYVTLN